MDISELQDKIDRELQHSGYAPEIKPFLVAPGKESFEDADGSIVQLWNIFKKDEFFIVYDDSADSFGIAFMNILNEKIFLGTSGSLIEAYEALISNESE